MAEVTFELRLDHGGIEAMLRGPEGAVAGDLRRRGNRVLNRAREEAPVATGALRQSLRLDMVSENGVPEARISSALQYSVYVHEGTGIYAGRGYIYPVAARFLVWRSRETGELVFARRVRGQPPNPFLKRALEAAAD